MLSDDVLLEIFDFFRRITTPPLDLKHFQRSYGIGTFWCMCAKSGDKSYLPHHSVSIYEFSAHTELLSGRIWIFGQPFLFILNISPRLKVLMKTISLLPSSTLIVSVLSAFG
jgi:hypothetical protein